METVRPKTEGSGNNKARYEVVGEICKVGLKMKDENMIGILKEETLFLFGPKHAMKALQSS